MFSHSLTAQLIRMLMLLTFSLVAVHHSPKLLSLLAQQAVDAGCHQTGQSDTTGHEHHSLNHNHTHHHHH